MSHTTVNRAVNTILLPAHLRPALAAGRCLNQAAATLAVLVDAISDEANASTRNLLQQLDETLSELVPDGLERIDLAKVLPAVVTERLSLNRDIPHDRSQIASEDTQSDCGACACVECPRSSAARSRRTQDLVAA